MTFTEEEFDRRVGEARARGAAGYVTADDRAFHAALGMAHEANRIAALVASWNNGGRKATAGRRMAQLRDIATGAAGGDVEERYLAVECGRCARALPAVYCGATHSMRLAESHGAPDDCRCAYEEREEP